MKNRALRVGYPIIPNMGDILNELVIKEIFGHDIVPALSHLSEVSAIGSGLGGYLYEGPLKHRIKQYIYGTFLNRKTYIWGTGFINYQEITEKFFPKEIQFCAVRGELTKQRVEKIIGKKLDIPTGDGGILASLLLKEKVEKKYAVGIIAHFKEQDEPIFNDLVDYYPNSTFIDVKLDPMTVIHQIAECDCIISSSLHGLIIADSLRVPNIHIVVSDKLMGDGYKFDDYYSAYFLPHKKLDMKKDCYPTLEWVMSEYSITDDMVKEKQQGLIKAFPYSKNTK